MKRTPPRGTNATQRGKNKQNANPNPNPTANPNPNDLLSTLIFSLFSFAGPAAMAAMHSATSSPGGRTAFECLPEDQNPKVGAVVVG